MFFTKRSQAGVSSESSLDSAKSIVSHEGAKGLYKGYSSNIAYAFPADAIKFLVSKPGGDSGPAPKELGFSKCRSTGLSAVFRLRMNHKTGKPMHRTAVIVARFVWSRLLACLSQ